MTDQENECYYELLGLTPKATAEDIRAAYKSACQKYHPDKDPNGKHKDHFAKIRKAYKFLQNETLRLHYDLSIKHGFNVQEYKIIHTGVVHVVLERWIDKISASAMEQVMQESMYKKPVKILKEILAEAKNQTQHEVRDCAFRLQHMETQLKGIKIEESSESIFLKKLKETLTQLKHKETEARMREVIIKELNGDVQKLSDMTPTEISGFLQDNPFIELIEESAVKIDNSQT